ncbi:hypothetical protein EON65_08675 [archaeon]|nr:MAG: hypothetical protein EON65_08675 [archaeon]
MFIIRGLSKLVDDGITYDAQLAKCTRTLFQKVLQVLENTEGTDGQSVDINVALYNEGITATSGPSPLLSTGTLSPRDAMTPPDFSSQPDSTRSPYDAEPAGVCYQYSLIPTVRPQLLPSFFPHTYPVVYPPSAALPYPPSSPFPYPAPYPAVQHQVPMTPAQWEGVPMMPQHPLLSYPLPHQLQHLGHPYPHIQAASSYHQRLALYPPSAQFEAQGGTHQSATAAPHPQHSPAVLPLLSYLPQQHHHSGRVDAPEQSFPYNGYSTPHSMYATNVTNLHLVPYGMHTASASQSQYSGHPVAHMQPMSSESPQYYSHHRAVYPYPQCHPHEQSDPHHSYRS